MSKRSIDSFYFFLTSIFFLILSLSGCGKVETKQDEELFTLAKPLAELPQNVPPLKDYGGIGGDFTLTNQYGNKFSLSELKGHPALLFFGYTYCPDICPITLSKAARVYELLGLPPESIRTIFISVDPERDTVEKIRDYLAYFQTGTIGLNGTREQIDAVVQQYGGHYDLNNKEDPDNYFVDHSTYTYLIDQTGRVRFLFRPDDDPTYIAAVAKQLL